MLAGRTAKEEPMSRKWSVVVCFFGLIRLAGPAFAQADNTDLHAAYCLTILRHERSIVVSIVKSAESHPAPASSPLGQAQQAAQQQYVQEQQAIRRIKGYLIPRLYGPALSTPDSLMTVQAAFNAANSDWQIINTATDTCAAKIDQLCAGKSPTDCNNAVHACMTQTEPNLGEIRDKIKVCREPTWLPY